MTFSTNELYHIYNRGNNKQRIFFYPENYIYFLKKVRKFILPHCDILAYCLMPNHFHFLVSTDDRILQSKIKNPLTSNNISEGIRNILHTYTKAINKQNSTTGSLFQQNTKSKCIVAKSKLYDLTCFNYIHQNPMKAGLVKKMEEWPYSSFIDYCGIRNGTLCDKNKAIKLLEINNKTFYEDSYKIIEDDELNGIF
jgi:putative transposase